jgi:hypothetical protein
MGKALVAIAIGVVFVILSLGIYTMWKGGATAATWSNKLMRLRVLAQFITIIIVILVVWASQSGH